MNDRHREAYREEAAELLVELEVALLELERQPEDTELVGRVFRALHTIKGSGAMFGFDAIVNFTHHLETVFDGVRQGRIAVTPALTGVTLEARDHIQTLVGSPLAGGGVTESGARILDRLRTITSSVPCADSQPNEGVCEPAVTSEASSYRIRFDPAPDILLNGSNPILLLSELGGLGDLSLMAHVDRIPQLEKIDLEKCYLHWDAVLTTAAGGNAIRDVFIFVEDQASIVIEPAGAASAVQPPRIGELMVARGDVSPDRLEAALLEKQHLERQRHGKHEAAATLRVPAAKLDNLVNIVGELVTVQARLSAFALGCGDPEAASIAEEVERLSELLRENTMSIRMLPIGETFGRLRRLVRDLSSDLGKPAELVTEGNDTELDKTVIEQLSDPLVHLIRNAVDHGLESPQRRLELGKPATGKIRLSASHEGAFVLVRVADDGAGLNRQAIRARAVERGLITAGTALTDQEIDGLILAPGFSTADQVTEISGRGVGMDVVKRGIDALRGSLTVNSRPGAGAEFTLKIPLTLAIIDGLLVEAGGERFVVPLSNVSECIELLHGPQSGAGRQSLVTVRGDLVPYIALRERFSLAGDRPPIEQVIIADTRDGKFGLAVDHVIGGHHTVVKKLGNLYRQIEEVSGATILGDGGIALILDVDKLVAGAVRNS
ncbi:MAG TPA: chemotaxis protein CheA [Bryobacteraceae bacterium]|nr:chemotaxis protein CheA [Bryobacteraceae bacterium]